MKVTFTKRFLQKLSKQAKYIAKDKPFAASKFEEDVLVKSLELINHPIYSYKKSSFFDDESIREFSFKGYRIIFKISKEVIKVFGFYKWQETLKI